MALLSTEDVDENKSKSCIILEFGRYLCHNGIREFLYSRRSSFDKTTAYLTFFSYVLVLKIRAYITSFWQHFSILQIARNQKDLTIDVSQYDLTYRAHTRSIITRGNLRVMHRCARRTFAYFYPCVAKRMSRERSWQTWQQNGSAYRANDGNTLITI